MTVWDYDSQSPHHPAREELADLIRNAGIVRAFVVRDIKIRYRRSVLGALWSLAGPLLMMVVLTVAFSQAFALHAPAFPAFVLPGLLLWNFFAQTTTAITGEAASGLDLWRRVRLPKCAQAVSTTITGLVHLAIATVPLIAIVAVLGRPLSWTLITVPVAMLLTAMFALGFALIAASIALYFPDAGHLYSIVIAAWMFVTPVVYPMAILPPHIQRWVSLNPMTLFVSAYRAPLYEGRSESPAHFVAMFATALLALLIGFVLFTRSAEEAPRRG